MIVSINEEVKKQLKLITDYCAELPTHLFSAPFDISTTLGVPLRSGLLNRYSGNMYTLVYRQRTYLFGTDPENRRCVFTYLDVVYCFYPLLIQLASS